MTLAGAAALPFQPYPHSFPPQAIRCLLIGCAALVAGAAAVAITRSKRSRAASARCDLRHGETYGTVT